MRNSLSIVALLAFAGAAHAGFFVETEANNTVATANFVGSYLNPGDAFVFDGAITPGNVQLNLPGDVDWLKFDVSGATQIVAALYGRPNSNIGDPQMILIDAFGAIIAADDDDNILLFPSLEGNVPAGTYYIGITGYNDLTLPGPGTLPDGFEPNGIPHTENFAYKLVVGLNIVPSPGAMGLLGLAGIATLRRRRTA